MRVLYVSKASVVAAYQDKLRSLAEYGPLHALLPAQWGRMSARETVDGVTVHLRSARFHGHNHFHTYRDAASVLTAARPDLVHLDEEPYSAVTFQFARMCSHARIPFVFFAWQNIYKTLPPPFGALRRYVFTHAAAAIAGTDQAAAVLRQGGWHGPSAVIPQLGVNTRRFQPDAESRRAQRALLDIPHDAFVAGFAGRVVHEKGVDLLVDAVTRLGDPRVHLLIIGDGPGRRRLQAQAELAGIGARVRFAGGADSLEMPRWLNALDVLVLPSRATPRWSEQFGRVLTESMSCGVPVIGSRTGEIAHVIGEAGRLFPENDAAALATQLRTLLDDVTVRVHLAAAGRARVEQHFSQEKIATATVALYERTLARAADDGRRARRLEART